MPFLRVYFLGFMSVIKARLREFYEA